MRNSLANARSRFITPGPLRRVGGVLPIPSDVAGGRTKLALLNAYHDFESKPAGGADPDGRNISPACWQRNGRPAAVVGVPAALPVAVGVPVAAAVPVQ